MAARRARGAVPGAHSAIPARQVRATRASPRPPASLAWALALAACGTGTEPSATAEPAEKPQYLGIETRLLEGDLVSFLVALEASDGRAAVARYAECAAAQYALIRGYGFARHVRTNVSEEGGVWRGDAVYTISSALPDGLRTLDAEVVVQSCRDEGIPTV